MFPGSNLPGHELVWTVQGIERMRLTAAGRLGIGVLAPAFTLDVNGDLNLPATGNVRVNGVVLVGSGGPGNYNRFYDTAGTATVQASTIANYYDNTSHIFRTVGGAATPLTITVASLASTVPVGLMGYTVAGLPASPVQGWLAYCTNLLTPTFGATAVGGGAVVGLVFYNGTAWVTV